MAIVLAVVVLLPLISYGILRSPRVQTYLGQRIASHLSRQLETNVSVGGVNVTFFLNFVLENVLIEDRQKQQMIFAGRMVFDISKISFRKRFLSISKLSFDQTFLGLARYQGEEEFNYQFLLDYFSPDRPETQPKRWDIICKSLEFKNSAFSFQDHNLVPTDYAFDPAHFSVAGFSIAIDDIRLKNDSLSFELDRLTFVEARGFELQYLSGSFLISPRLAHVNNLIVRTPKSELKLEANFEYKDYDL